MKLFNQFTILPRYLKAFNYAGNRMEETKRNLKKDNYLIEDYWKGNAENIQLISIVQSIATENFNFKG